MLSDLKNPGAAVAPEPVPALTTAAKAMQEGKNENDPNDINFMQQQIQYMDKTTSKLKFQKASFLHYCQNPYVYEEEFGGIDTLLTMELIQVPKGLKYQRLGDPDEAKKLKKAEQVKYQALQNAESRRRDKEAVRQAEDVNTAINEDGEREDGNGEQQNTEEGEENNQEESENYYDEDDYGRIDYNDEGDEAEDDQASNLGGNGESQALGEEREYNGDMFGKNGETKFRLINRENVEGTYDRKSDTLDSAMISVWRIGGAQLHYSRIADVIIPYPPIAGDDNFYCSHTCDAIYYLTKVDEKQAIIIVYLADLRWKIVELGTDIPKLSNLQHSSLIAVNHVLCINIPKAEGSKRISGDFIAFDLYNMKKIWQAKNAEIVFFKGESMEEVPKQEGDDGENPVDGTNLKINLSKKQIFSNPNDKPYAELSEENKKFLMPEAVVLHLSVETVEQEHKEVDQPAKVEKKTKLFYRYYKISDFKSKDYIKHGELFWEYSLLTSMKPEVKEEEKPAGQQLLAGLVEGVQKIFETVQDTFLEQKPEEDDDEEVSLKGGISKDGKPIVIYAHSYSLSDLVMVIMGTQGEGHRVEQFNSDQGTVQSRCRGGTVLAGNCRVKLNQNSFLRDTDMIFIITIYADGTTEAKRLQSNSVSATEKIPNIDLINVDENYAIDCWINKENNGFVIQTIGKSQTDEYLNCSSMDVKPYLDAASLEELKKLKGQLKTLTCKLKGQEIQMVYPLLASNIGTKIMNVQSMAQPNIQSQFTIPEGDFIAFVSYNDLNEIGFKDSRQKGEKIAVQFNETGEYIAFLSRVHGKCGKLDACKRGDLILNILYVDSYAEPMSFKLFTADYEACMEEGSRDDIIHKAFALRVKSARGEDVTLCIQYNDCIIFDCITSTKQLPIIFPTSKEDLTVLSDDGETKWQDLKATKDIKIVSVPIFMDEKGSIYFLVKNETKQVYIYRVNTIQEMGEDTFFQLVYKFQSSWVYFFQKHEKKFYLMDDSKKIRILVQDAKTNLLSISTTMELCKGDKEFINKTPFDEYAVSNGCIHNGGKAFYMIENKQKDNPTWYSFDVMIRQYEFVSGPKSAKGSGQIYFMEKYAVVDDDKKKGPSEEDVTKLQTRVKESGASKFGAFCIVMQPKADLSFVECLPMFHENNNNFFSFFEKDKVIAQYGGKFLVFNVQGQFQSQVVFDCEKNIKKMRLRLLNFCESKKFFVFEGPEFKQEDVKTNEITKTKEVVKTELAKAENLLKGTDKNIQVQEAKKQSQKQVYYIFALLKNTLSYGKNAGKTIYILKHLKMDIEPFAKEAHLRAELRLHTHITMTSGGTFNQTNIAILDQNLQAIFTDIQALKKLANIKFDVQVHLAKSYLEEKKDEEQKLQIDQLSDENKNYLKQFYSGDRLKKDINFIFEFDTSNVIVQVNQLERRIAFLESARDKAKAKNQNFLLNDNLVRQHKKRLQLYKAWKFGEYVIVKCGSDVKYATVNDIETKTFNFNLGDNIWLENVFQTSVEGLLQFYVIDDVERIIYAITWNMLANREHSLFQTTYKQGQFPENLILQSINSQYGLKNYNFCLEDGAIINLENNVPIQFFDKENEGDLVPHGLLKNTVSGQKKISEDQNAYLDLLVPGRIQHFISLTDIMYWKRFQKEKATHELSKGKVSTFSPVARFPKGISVFHQFATNELVINTFRGAVEQALAQKNDDKRIQLLPLMFIHKHPIPNKLGHRVTPLQIALQNKSPVCFEAMLCMLQSQTSICITGALLEIMGDIINSGMPSVATLMNESFRITDQLSGPRPLKWPSADQELIINVPTAYLTDKTLQQLVYKVQGLAPPEEPEPVADDKNILQDKNNEDGFLKYTVEGIEEILKADEGESVFKQVEAKLLDFDWIFTGDNSSQIIKLLAETENDNIFSCTQIRILIDFMWNDYYKAIMNSLFLPFCLYFLSFMLYSTFIENADTGSLNWNFVAKITCLVIFGKTFSTFLCLELIQFKDDPIGYISDFWNLLDLISLVLNAVFVYLKVANKISPNPLNVLGSFAMVLLWFKLFYWLRLFKPFSAFIRIISEIIKDIQVFSAMLLLCLMAFANIVMILQNNRSDSSKNNADEQLFSVYTGIAPVDAMIHAYLTGLGDFNYGNYDAQNGEVMWLYFLGATFLVQLVFMNMLIAIMGESFGRILAIQNQSILKELCVMMDDHMWLLNISEIYSQSRYILWLTPGASAKTGTLVEYQIGQLRNFVEVRAEQSDNFVQRQITSLDEKLDTITAMLEAQAKSKSKRSNGDDGDYDDEDDDDEDDE